MNRAKRNIDNHPNERSAFVLDVNKVQLIYNETDIPSGYYVAAIVKSPVVFSGTLLRQAEGEMKSFIHGIGGNYGFDLKETAGDLHTDGRLVGYGADSQARAFSVTARPALVLPPTLNKDEKDRLISNFKRRCEVVSRQNTRSIFSYFSLSDVFFIIVIALILYAIFTSGQRP